MIPQRLAIKLLLPNVTSRHPLEDMVIIAALTVGCEVMHLRNWLSVFDKEGGFEAKTDSREQQRRGYKGLKYGGKPHILDCMAMLKDAWGGTSGRCAASEGLKCFWGEADVLAETLKVNTNKDVGRASILAKKSVLSKEDSDELCDLMSSIKFRANVSSVDLSSSTVNTFKDSFVSDGDLSRDDMENVAEVWVDIENDEDIVNAVIDDKMQEIDEVNVSKPGNYHHNDDEEKDIITVFENPCKVNKKKHTYQEDIGSFGMIQSFMHEQKWPSDHRLVLERL